MALFTETDILEYVPDILEYGIQDFSDDIARSEADIYRLLRIQWWPDVASKYSDITRVGGRSYGEMDNNKVDPAQIKRAGIFHVLAYYILPKLAKFEVDGDRFIQQMEYFKSRFDEEFGLAIRELKYDTDSDGVFEDSEIVHREQLKLVR